MKDLLGEEIKVGKPAKLIQLKGTNTNTITGAIPILITGISKTRVHWHGKGDKGWTVPNRIIMK